MNRKFVWLSTSLWVFCLILINWSTICHANQNQQVSFKWFRKWHSLIEFEYGKYTKWKHFAKTENIVSYLEINIQTWIWGESTFPLCLVSKMKFTNMILHIFQWIWLNGFGIHWIQMLNYTFSWLNCYYENWLQQNSIPIYFKIPTMCAKCPLFKWGIIFLFLRYGIWIFRMEIQFKFPRSTGKPKLNLFSFQFINKKWTWIYLRPF